jgi:transposase
MAMETTQEGAREFAWLVGIDWGTAEHQIDLADAQGRHHQTFTVEHTPDGLAHLVGSVARATGGEWARVAVALEVPRGALIEVFLERGAAVFALNPKQLDRFRDRFSVAGAKDDVLDARVLRSALQTDRALFRRVAPEAPLIIRVRELTRADAVLQREGHDLTNRVRELVHRIAPTWLTLSPAADDPWFWEFLALVATPELGRRVRRKTLQALLAARRIRRVTVDDLYAALEPGPLPVAAGTIEAVTGHLQLLIPRLQLVAEQRAACERALTRVVAQLAAGDDEPPAAPGGGDASGTPPAAPASPPDGPPQPNAVAILKSLPGVGIHITATFVADASAQLQCADYDGLRRLTGIAPVRRQTGKRKAGVVHMRQACNQRLRNACYHMANISLQLDAAARAYYATLRARGHSHGRALRSVADRWLRILTAMLKQRTLYNPTRFQAVAAVPAAATS